MTSLFPSLFIACFGCDAPDEVAHRLTQVEQRTLPPELPMASPELPGGHQILEQDLDSGYSPSAAAGSSSVSTTSRSRICSPTPSFFHSFTSSLNDATVSGWVASHPGSSLSSNLLPS